MSLTNNDVAGVSVGGSLPLRIYIGIDINVERSPPFDPCSPSKLFTIFDFFISWTHHLVADFGIPRIVFYSSNAFNIFIL